MNKEKLIPLFRSKMARKRDTVIYKYERFWGKIKKDFQSVKPLFKEILKIKKELKNKGGEKYEEKFH